MLVFTGMIKVHLDFKDPFLEKENSYRPLQTVRSGGPSITGSSNIILADLH